MIRKRTRHDIHVRRSFDRGKYVRVGPKSSVTVVVMQYARASDND